METGKLLGVEAGAALPVTIGSPHGSPARPNGLDGLKANSPAKDASSARQWLASWKHNFFLRENANFGTWDGVFPTCLAHLLNVIVFLRTGLVVADAGVLLAFSISIICVAFASVTILSAVGILRRSSVECRDVYHILATTLGTRVAGAVGLVYAFTHVASSALQVLGMGELVVGISYNTNQHHDWVIAGVACGCLAVLTALNVFGIKWIIRAQYVIVVLIALGVGDFFVGSLFRTVDEPGHEILGPSGKTLHANLYPVFTSWHGYFASLGIFFPSTVGVLVGFNIASDLRDPHRSIPKGTFAALFTSMGVHFLFILMLGACVARDVLRQHPHTAVRMAAIQAFIIIAIFVSSFASGMGAIFNASRILARVAKDTSMPGLRKLDWVWERFQTPVLSLAVVSSFSLLFVLVGKIDFLAPIITTSHFLTFSCINYAYFALSTTYKLQVNRELTATTQWLQQGLREGRIASPESRSPKARSPADGYTGTMSHSSSVTSERSHLLGSGVGSQVTTPKDPLLFAKVASPVLSKPDDGPLKYHHRFVALAAAVIMVIFAFIIQWESALSTVSSLGLIYILVYYFSPKPTPGIVEFHPLDYILSKITHQPFTELQNVQPDAPTVSGPEASKFIASAGSPSSSDHAPFIPRQR